MRSARADVGDGVELAYDLFDQPGRVAAMPLVLIMGIGAQRIFWDDELCAQLVAAGFSVVRFDHREIGESSRLDLPVPSPLRSLGRRAIGAWVPAPYDLSDLATDVARLIEAVGWRSAHVVGASLGGMVGQHLALEHPDRVRSLTSIMSSPGARRFVPAPRAMRALFAPAPKTAADAGRSVVTLFGAIGSPAYTDENDRERLRAIGEESFRRGQSPRGFLRQFSAVLASGDRTPRLASVRAPTLVIHGTRDPMFSLAAGRTVAERIPNATWLPIAGMGHDTPRALWPTLVAAIAKHATAAERRAGARAA